MLADVTPLILTYNEAPNIQRTLGQLSWAREIVVVDSGSTDETVAILARTPRVRVIHRQFDSHAKQWNFGLHETGITTAWVLALDADYVLSSELVNEISALRPPCDVVAYTTSFRYCVSGKPLRGTAYPAKVTLFRREGARYEQDGHTQLLATQGKVRALRHLIYHDDRKPLHRWVTAQNRYMELEAAKLSATAAAELSRGDRLRRCIVLAPPAMFLYCVIVRRNLLDGLPGLYYALQRTCAELLLSLHLLELLLGKREHSRTHR